MSRRADPSQASGFSDTDYYTSSCIRHVHLREVLPGPAIVDAVERSPGASHLEAPGEGSRRPVRATGFGNWFPTPPQCLQKVGRFRGNGGEASGVDEDVESAAHQQFDRKSATSRRLLKPLLTKCNSRRLHQFSSIGSTVERAVPGASNLTECLFREECRAKVRHSRRLHGVRIKGGAPSRRMAASNPTGLRCM